MKKISISRLNTLMRKAKNLQLQEKKSITYDDVELLEEEAILTEFIMLEFHIARIAMEIENIEDIKYSKIVMDYAKMQFEKGNMELCKKSLTMLKLFFGLDVTFFTMLPSISEYVRETGPLKLEDLARPLLDNLLLNERIDMESNYITQQGEKKNDRDPKKPRNK